MIQHNNSVYVPGRATRRLNKLHGTKKWEARFTYVERQVLDTPLIRTKAVA